MTRILSELLGVKDLPFRLSIEQLEKASGRPSADIRLSTDIAQAAQQKLRNLGLDPKDSVLREVYEMLLERVRSDNDRLEGALIHQKEQNKITTNSIAKTLAAVQMPKSCFALKHSVAKRLLKIDPPKNTLKKLGYRSIDSLLKREPIAAVFAAAYLLESIGWQKKLIEQYKDLQPGDFETRAIEILAPRSSHWLSLVEELATKRRTTVAVCKELGGLVILPLPLNMPGSTLATLILSLQAINDIRVHSAFCKLQQVRHDFGETVAKAIQDDVRGLILIAGQPLPWYVIQRHYAKFTEDYPLELFEPHVHQEDLQMVNVEEVLSYIEPTLEFWLNTSYLGMTEGKNTVSFNLIDNAINCSNRLAYDKRITTHMEQNIWCELLLKYLQEKELERAVVRQLDAQLVDNQDQPTYNVAFA